MNAEHKIKALLAEASELHASIEKESEGIGCTASATLVAAWLAGKSLSEAKSLLRAEKGHGHWEAHAKESFSGSLPTATRYMRLYKSFRGVQDLPAKSLHQVYRQLGMLSQSASTDKSSPTTSSPMGHVYHARKVISHVRKTLGANEEPALTKLRGELNPLWAELKRLYPGPLESTR